MPRTVEHIVACHKAASARREAGKPVWDKTGAHIDACTHITAVTYFPVLFQHDIDDTGVAARGIVFGRGIGDQFDVVDGIRRNLVEREGA